MLCSPLNCNNELKTKSSPLFHTSRITIGLFSKPIFTPQDHNTRYQGPLRLRRKRNSSFPNFRTGWAANVEQWGEREKTVKWDTHPHAMLMKHFTSRKIYNAKAEKSSRVRFPTFKLLTFHGPEVSNSRFCTLSLSDLDPNAAIITYSFKVAIPIRIRFLPRESVKLSS